MSPPNSEVSPLDANRPESLRLRHRPVQQRGRVRFDQILRSARELLLEKGIEGFVMEDIATHAGIPVGFLYQFFPNKLAVVAELAEMDTAALTMLLSKTPMPAALDDSGSVIDAVVDHAVRKWVEEPSRSAIWLAMKSTEVTRVLAHEETNRVALAIAPLLAPMNPERTKEQREIAATVVVEATQSLLLFAFRENRVNEAAVVELKRMLRAYLRAVARNQS